MDTAEFFRTILQWITLISFVLSTFIFMIFSPMYFFIRFVKKDIVKANKVRKYIGYSLALFCLVIVFFVISTFITPIMINSALDG